MIIWRNSLDLNRSTDMNHIPLPSVTNIVHVYFLRKRNHVTITESNGCSWYILSQIAYQDSVPIEAWWQLSGFTLSKMYPSKSGGRSQMSLCIKSRRECSETLGKRMLCSTNSDNWLCYLHALSNYLQIITHTNYLQIITQIRLSFQHFRSVIYNSWLTP